MFKSITEFFHKFRKSEKEESKSTAKERLHLVLAQDRANISADFLEMMKQEILEVIKKYIDIDEKAIDVRLTNKEGEDGKVGAPALYANIPIITIKNEARKLEGTLKKDETEKEDKKENTEEVSNNQEKTHNIEEEQEIDANANDEAEEPNAEEAETDQERVDENAIEEVEDEKKNS
jgi:cell division topological specificity factor